MKEIGRQSNIELLRILSIFLILIVHADFLIIGTPNTEEIIANPLSTTTRVFFEMISIICVDIFVFISGWFGIHFSLRGIFKLIFQIIFIQSLIYLFSSITGHGQFSIFGLLMLDKSFWFIKAYIGLYILSPLINNFVKNSTTKSIIIILLSYYTFQTIYAWITDGAWFLNGGYCITSLSAIYLLARFMQNNITIDNYKLSLKGNANHKYLTIRNKYIFLIAFLLITSLNTSLFLLSFFVPFGCYFGGNILYYTNPFIIVQSICIFMFFLNCKINTNKVINWVASSAFAVFIIHSGAGMQYYRILIESIYEQWSGVYCLGIMFVAMVCVYVLAILIDIPRKIIWQRIARYIPDMRLKEAH